MNVAEYEAMYRVEDTHWWYVGMRRIAERVLGVRLRPGMAILDAGCGTGGNLRWLSRFGRAYGVDLSPHALRFCAQRRLETVARASILALPFPDATFDAVTSFDVIYHLDVEDDRRALEEMKRVLSPGGWLLVRVPALEWLRGEHDAAVHTRQRYSLDELRQKVRAAGLEPLRATHVNTLLFPLAAARRVWGKRQSHEAQGTRRTGKSNEGVKAGKEGQRSDVHPVVEPVNAAFKAVMAAEAALLSAIDLPVGLSALVLAERGVA